MSDPHHGRKVCCVSFRSPKQKASIFFFFSFFRASGVGQTNRGQPVHNTGDSQDENSRK